MHTHARIHTKHSPKSSNAAEKSPLPPPSPPIQGCFYGNKLQFLAQKSGNLQEVCAASRQLAGGWLEDYFGGHRRGRSVKELAFKRGAAGTEMPASSMHRLNSGHLSTLPFSQAINSISLMVSLQPSPWLALLI